MSGIAGLAAWLSFGVACSPTAVVGTGHADTSTDASGHGDEVGSAESGSSGSGGDMCAPAVEDSACESCLKTTCCELFAECTQASSCECMLACLGEQPAQTCATQCAPGGEYGAIVGCVVTQCAEDCA